MMRRIAGHCWMAILTLAILSLCVSCGKSSGGPEANLAVTLNPAAGSTQPPAVGPFSLNVKITSGMPSKGVTIAIVATPDGSNTTYFTTSVNSTKASNDFTIANSPVGETLLVKVTVTSLSTATNTWTGSYRYSAK